MKLNPILLASLFAVILGSSILFSSFADTPFANTSPSNLAPDQATTITIGDTIAFHVTSISVTGPDGTVYTHSCTISECNGDSSNSVTIDFGSGLSMWKVTVVGSGCAGYTSSMNGPANTHCGGQYSVSASGVALSTTPRFTVDSGFGVPEFGLPVVIIAALGMLLLAFRQFASSRRNLSVS